MRKIKLTRANKIILLKALGDYYYRQRTMNTGWLYASLGVTLGRLP